MGCTSSKEGSGAQVVPFLANGTEGAAAWKAKGGVGASWGQPTDMPPQTTVVLVVGDPASGKTTMCRKLVERYQFTHLVTGDLLREEVEQGTVTGKWANDLMQQGKQVPDQVSITLLKNAMIASTKHAAHSSNVMLVDGFPRTMEQVMLCQQEMGMAHAVVFLEVSEPVSKARWMSDGGSGDAFKSMFQKSRKQAQTVKQHFVGQGNCHVVDASKSPNVVFAEVSRILENLEMQRNKELAPRPSMLSKSPSPTSVADGPHGGAHSDSDGESDPQRRLARPSPGAQALTSARASPQIHPLAPVGSLLTQHGPIDSPEVTGRRDTLAAAPQAVPISRQGTKDSLNPKTPIPKRLQPLQGAKREQAPESGASGASGAGPSGAGSSGDEQVPPGGLRAPWQRTPMTAPQRIAPLKLSMGQHEEIGEVEERGVGGISGKRRLDMSNVDDRRMLDQLLDHVRNSPSRVNSPHVRATPQASPGARLSPGGHRTMSRQVSVNPSHHATRFSTPGHIGDDHHESPTDRYTVPGSISRQGSLARQLNRYDSPSRRPHTPLSRQSSIAGAHGGGSFIPEASSLSPARKNRTSMPGGLMSRQTSMMRQSDPPPERSRTQSGAPVRQVSISSRPPMVAGPGPIRTTPTGTVTTPRSILRKPTEPPPSADPLGGVSQDTRSSAPSPAGPGGIARQTSVASRVAPGSASDPLAKVPAPSGPARQSSIARPKPSPLNTSSRGGAGAGISPEPSPSPRTSNLARSGGGAATGLRASAEPSPRTSASRPGAGKGLTERDPSPGAATGRSGTSGTGAGATGTAAPKPALIRQPSPNPRRPGPIPPITPLPTESPNLSPVLGPRASQRGLSLGNGATFNRQSSVARGDGGAGAGDPSPTGAALGTDGRPKTQGVAMNRQTSMGATSLAAAAKARPSTVASTTKPQTSGGGGGG